MIARPFSLFYNAFNMKLIHACFRFFLDIKTPFRGQSRGKRPVLDLNNVSPDAKPPVSVRHFSVRAVIAFPIFCSKINYSLLFLRYMLSFLQVVFYFRAKEMYLRLISDEKPFPL